MSNMNAVTIDRQTKTAYFGTGVLLGQAYWQLWCQGRFTIPAGLCPFVGIGGHTLGGGYGLLARKFGMLSDNVISMEVVTADGKVLHADSRLNRHLFWALRGAGNNNFGIVTNIRTKIHDVSYNLTLVHKKYELKYFREVFAWQKWVKSNPDRSATSDVLFDGDCVQMYVVITEIDQAKSFRIANDIHKRMPRNETIDIRNSFHFIEMVKYFAKVIDPLGREVNDSSLLGKGEQTAVFAKVKSYYTQRLTTDFEMKTMFKLMNEAPKGTFVLFEMQGGAIADFKSTDTAFFHRKANLFSVMIGYDTPDYSNSDEGVKWMKQFYDETKSLNSGYSFFNLADEDLDNWLQRYYGANSHNLKKIKKKYDPNNLFTYKQSIPLS
ncbi:hypothetical protein B4U80_13568 [Leptotrombidium deliense]|uniref:FAD-binding PCMH-type domain-containing protein n=1 Tax=Leptotrombidium deliense TaxID=299467 RepID=A0A443S4A9_9ACAR|nr:hypothetical protein B4U80_13568 [Leptotrombidium deliense]